ncbi:Spy/CpxP family protein refolding chaperone [Winogradskyella aurantiaca]|uniref:Spy/CpxP family protein refolding chaperone n=1 Tax=Winogradskyella aurantiaca TaxID=2219558 RepID=UPI00130037D7|nr:Spy/CpxP family protein refolding chaperone [Winogradskyella aurantiaca]
MKYLVFFIIAIISLNVSHSQNDKMRERIKAQKIAFITAQLQLTTEEAQAFWPVFNAYEADTESVKNKQLRPVRKAMRNSESLSDEEAVKLIDNMITAETELHQLRLNLISDLKGVLPPQKILKLKAADDEFNKKLFERLKEMRQRRNGNKD